MKPQDRHSAIWNSPHLSGPERFLMLALSSFVNSSTGWAWPSAAKLAEMTGSKRQTVSARLKSLVARGLLEQRPGKRMNGGQLMERRPVWGALGAGVTPGTQEDHGTQEDPGTAGADPGTPADHRPGTPGDHEPDHRTDQGTDQERSAREQVLDIWAQEHQRVTGTAPAWKPQRFVDQDVATLVHQLKASGREPEDLRQAMACFLTDSRAGVKTAIRKDGERYCFGWFTLKAGHYQVSVAPPPPEPSGPPAEVVELPAPEPQPDHPDDLELLDSLLLAQLAEDLDPSTHEVFLKPCRRSESDPTTLWAPNPHLGAVLWQRAAPQLQAAGFERVRSCA